MIAQIMEHEHEEKEQETSPFMPVIPRLDRLDRLLQLLEVKQSFSRRHHQFCANSLSESMESDERKTLSLALEEVQHKGTLMDRLALLENRVLKLSLDIDEGNTSKSSSSTAQVCSETTYKDSEVSNIPPNQEYRLTDTSQVMQDAQVIQEQEGDSSSAVDVVTNRRAQRKISSAPRKKTQKKWLGLFRFPLMC